MTKTWIYFLFLFIGLISHGQQCPTFSYPRNGSEDVPVDATISWTAVDGINGYLISLGTTPGGEDILSRSAIGVNNSFTAPTGLPENTLIYVSISIVLFDAPPIACTGISFRTMDVTTPPPCTYLIAPDNNAANVTIVTELVWEYSSTATSYRLSIGTVPGGMDILDNLNVGNVLSYDPPKDLPQDTQIYVHISPVNENGSMAPCTEESFFTGPLVDYCAPYLNNITNEMIYPKPEIEFPDQIGICSNDLPYTITTEDIADGFRWFKTNSGSTETLISESRNVPITEPGKYRYEAYNTIMADDKVIECYNSKLFTVVTSGIATIEAIDVLNVLDGKKITIHVSGIGNYEFALDNTNGPYQDSPIFDNVPSGQHTVYVRDKNACGTVDRTVDRDLVLEDFPNFFTPNGDGINDLWQFVPPQENFEMNVEVISIFDRYGNFLERIEANSLGWDGNYNGRPLPSSDYWFKANTFSGQEIKGHFSLKR